MKSILLAKSAQEGFNLCPAKLIQPEILRDREVAARKFDPRSAVPFVNKSVSDATRRAYSRAV
jgi:hypothetical protein